MSSDVDTEHTAETVSMAGPPSRRRTLHRGVCVGRYVVIDRVGEGGMGVVYKAYDPELERAVALKFLHAEASPTESEGSTRRDRLLREAKALARLSHPNVVAVYDVGTYENDVFVATEFLEGATLRQWMRDTPRSRAEILAAFLAAGEGLAAAHRADLVHRDFKPGNVIVGNDGRVRVLDFGLARASSTEDAPSPPSVPSPPSERPSLLSSPLTEVGQVIGTPRYMAPEQHLGQKADARCDQFAFAVALWEALYADLPFEGGEADYKRNVIEGNLRPPSEKKQVPRAIHKALVRGLARSPADRFPSMDAMLLALAGAGRARGRRLAVIAALTLFAFSGTFAWARARHDQAPKVCGGAEERLAGVWDDARRDAVKRAFLSTGAPWADEASRSVSQVLDDYARKWIAMHTDACLATRVRGEQSEDLLDLRMQCLEQDRQELRAEVDVFARGDASALENAAAAARALPKLDACADIAALRAPMPAPKDAETRAKVESLGARLADVRALQRAGSYRAALPGAKDAADQASALGYRPLEADALFLRGDIEDDGGDYKAAEKTLEAAAEAALAGRNERTAARALTALVIVIGLRQARYDEARAWNKVAEGEAERTGDPFLRGEVRRDLGRILYAEEKYEESRAAIERCLDLWIPALGEEDLAVAGALTDLGNVYFAEEKDGDARDAYTRSLGILEKGLGPDHPGLAPDLNNLSGVEERQGDMKGAIAATRRALALWEAALGPDHQKVGVARYNLGQQLLHDGQVAAAMPEAERADVVFEKALPPSHPLVSMGLIGLAEVVQANGDLPRARGLYERGLSLAEKADHPDGGEIGEALLGLGEIDLAANAKASALARLTRAALLLEKDEATEPKDLARAKDALARASR